MTTKQSARAGSPTPLSLDWRDFTGPQREGWACAYCGNRLYRDRLVGTVTEPTGHPDHFRIKELWACDPPCRNSNVRARADRSDRS
ncbi:hypothetical protein [Streptomyces sp. CBMA152]|uniref:hypothetical protein n=1 Tax=Streptomyces sp. CBMA152 TaxID=1896312 RepID=UPI0016606FFE|nr:hypothetical protein [Streptomyces sp. CBMA152]